MNKQLSDGHAEAGTITPTAGIARMIHFTAIPEMATG